MDTAPILLFVYNRPAHTRQALEALSRNTLAAVHLLRCRTFGSRLRSRGRSEAHRKGSQRFPASTRHGT